MSENIDDEREHCNAKYRQRRLREEKDNKNYSDSVTYVSDRWPVNGC